jgi:hypothetical protein
MRALVIAVGLVLMACGGGSEIGVDAETLYETGGSAGAVVEATGGEALTEATGGDQETGGNTTGGTVPATGGTATGGAQTGGTATGGSTEPVCEAGRQVACPCVGIGDVGVQSCLADGSGWGECECSDPATGGNPTGGMGTGGLATGGTTPTGGTLTGGSATGGIDVGTGGTTSTGGSDTGGSVGTGGTGPTTETACWDHTDDDEDGATDCDDSDCCTAEYCCEADGTCHSDHIITLGVMIDCMCWELCDPDARPSGGSADIGINPDTHHCVFVGSPAYNRAQTSCSVTG